MNRSAHAADSKSAQPASNTDASSRAVLKWGLLGALLTYLAHPPVGWSLLAWIGPAAWIAMVRWPQLPGRRPYRALWVAGLAYWLLTIAWLRLPHPANWGALAFVASYLGGYLPLFVALSRIAVHRLNWPVWIAAPVAWTGLELARAHLLTGLLMGSLAHTQVGWPWMLQIAEYGGEYAVTFLIMATASLLAEAIADVTANRRRALVRATAAVALPLVAFGCSMLIDAGLTPLSVQDGTARIALIQSDLLADWKGTRERDEEVMRQQERLSAAAVRESDEPLDLVVWPETMFRMALHQPAAGYEPPSNLFPELFGATAAEVFGSTPEYLKAMVKDLQTPVLVGVDRKTWRDPAPDEPPLYPDVPHFGVDSFNSCVMVDREGQLVGAYDKMHLLPFGEYVPLARWIPLLRRITPITGGAVPGAGPASLPLPLASDPQRTVRYCPSICYETALPHVIRRQVAELSSRGESPDVLVNLTNDAWYWGSAELDMHLAAAVLRAVETRTPVVIAANRGLTAHIDRFGTVQAVTKRDTADKLIAEVAILGRLPPRPTFYVRFGDWLPGACLLCCMAFAVIGWRNRT